MWLIGPTQDMKEASETPAGMGFRSAEVDAVLPCPLSENCRFLTRDATQLPRHLSDLNQGVLIGVESNRATFITEDRQDRSSNARGCSRRANKTDADCVIDLGGFPPR
jgi:hypothetical protein